MGKTNATSAPDVLEPLNLDEVPETAPETAQETAQETAPEPKVDPMQEMVAIQLFKDNRRYKEDLKIFINGRNWVIQRGVPVQVPRYVALLIQQSQKQDQASDSMIMKLVEDYEKKTMEATRPM